MENLHNARVLVGTPTHFEKNYCFDDWADNVMGLLGTFDLCVIDNTKNLNNAKRYRKKFAPLGDRVKVINQIPSKVEESHPPTALAASQNRIRKEFLDGNYTHLLMLESDVFPRKDIIQYCLARNADIFNCTYLIQRTMGICVYTHMNHHYFGKTSTNMMSMETSRMFMGRGDIRLGQQRLSPFIYVSGCGVGCTLMTREVMEEIPFRSSIKHDMKSGFYTFSDSFFHLEANQKRFINLLDTNYIVEHRYSVKHTNTEEMDTKQLAQIQHHERVIGQSKRNAEIYSELSEVKKKLIDKPDDKDALERERQLEKEIESIDCSLQAEQSEATALAQANHMTKFMESVQRNATKTQ